MLHPQEVLTADSHLQEHLQSVEEAAAAGHPSPGVVGEEGEVEEASFRS